MTFLVCLERTDHAAEDRADAHHHGQVVQHIAAKLRLHDIVGQLHRVDHEARDAKLLVDAPHHDALVHALVLAPDEVTVHINVEVAHGVDERKRHVHEDIVHVEAVLGELQAGFAEQLGAIDGRMHEQVLALAEMLHVFPAELFLGREHVEVSHHRARALVHLLVDIVADDEVGCMISVKLRAKIGHDLAHRVLIEPVVGVDDLEVQALGSSESGVHGSTMAPVFLMDGTDNARVGLLPSVSLLGGVVFCRTVVDDDDLDVVTAGQKRLDAFVHVGGGVVARHRERDGLHESYSSTSLSESSSARLMILSML